MAESILTITQVTPLTFEANVYGDKIKIGEKELLLILKIINSKSSLR